jgi:hypothetical protein
MASIKIVLDTQIKEIVWVQKLEIIKKDQHLI